MIIGAQKGGRTKGRSLHRRSMGAKRPVETVLIEPDTLFRAGLEHILASTRFHILATVDTIAELEGVLRSKRAPSLFIVRISGETEDIVKDVTALKVCYPESCVVCISHAYEPDAIITLLCAGVNGLMLRSVSAGTFLKALDLVIAGERIVPQQLLELTGGRTQDDRAPQGPPPAAAPSSRPASAETTHLSSREQDILQLLVNGEANKMIALKLDISEATVKVHIRAILRKIQVKNRTQAAIWALNHHQEVEASVPNTEPQAAPVDLTNGACKAHDVVSKLKT